VDQALGSVVGFFKSGIDEKKGVAEWPTEFLLQLSSVIHIGCPSIQGVQKLAMFQIKIFGVSLVQQIPHPCLAFLHLQTPLIRLVVIDGR
jgi:hypothetical protein